MKKLLLISMAIISVSLAKAQPVSDIAIIPIGVNLNSILRLQVISGGNIEFAVNSIDLYTTGVTNTDATSTTFAVSSTVNFIVNLYSEGNLVGTDLAGTIPVENIGYLTTITGTGLPANYTIPATVKALTSTITPIVTGNGPAAAGKAAQNTFKIQWELATPAVILDGGAGTLLSQNIAPDRYVVNAFLDLDVAP